MSPRHNGDAYFRVTFLGLAKEQLTRIIRRRAQIGRVAEALSAARQIDRRLRTDPRDFGEPIRLRPHARIEERRAAVAPLVVYYGVHQDLPEVFIREFRDLL
jgi:hypothetical protein